MLAVTSLLAGVLCTTSPARAAESECGQVAEALAGTEPAGARIESARGKLADAPACGYLVADAVRTGLPPGPNRTRIVDETLEMSRDWVPSTGPLSIGYLKAAILAADDPTLDLPVWKERMPSHLISLRNLTTPREMAEFEAVLAKRYLPMLDNPFAIEDCDRLPDTLRAETRAKLAEACAERRRLLAACEPLLQSPETATAEATNACEAQRMKLAERYPRASGQATMTDIATRLARSRQALARMALERAGRDRSERPNGGRAIAGKSSQQAAQPPASMKLIPGRWVKGHGYAIYRGGSRTECEQRCRAEDACRMFEYYYGDEDGGVKCNLFKHQRVEKERSPDSDVGIKF